MKVTPRQAHKLIDKIHARLAALEIAASRNVNIWEVSNGDDYFATARAELFSTINQNNDLIAVRQEIRDSIQKTNVRTIDSLIAQRKFLLDQIGGLRHILATVNPNAIQTPAGLGDKIHALRTSASASSSAYGHNELVTVSVLSKEEVAEMEGMLRGQQLAVEKVEDLLTHENSSSDNVITLSERAVTVLTAAGVI